MEQKERVIRTEKIYEGRILTLSRSTVELENQKYAKREIVEHGGSVVVLAFTKEDKIVFVKQYRVAVGKNLLELPAGLIDHGETPRDAALRELEEETGFKTNSIQFLFEFFSSPGFTTEKIHLFETKDILLGKRDLDEEENIEIVEYTVEEALKMVKLGQITDAKTIMGILHASLERK